MAKRYKCPYCEKRLERDKLITHVEDDHEDLIPENHTPRQVVFNSINKKTHGTCVVCGKDTKWNEKAGKYDRLCYNPKCREKLREEFKKNATAKDGIYNYAASPEFQEKMLKGRKISSTYKFTDGGKVDYVGSYEKKFLEFVDKVMNIESKDIIGPGPTIEYQYEGETHYWITDFYYVPANLVLDIKDGGKNPNNRPMEEYREKQIAKEDAIRKLKKYNYLRLTDNDFSQFMEVLVDLKSMALDMKERQLVTQINETAQLKIKLYHLSEKNLDNKILNPKIPSNFLTKNGYEDSTSKRVCFSKSIDGCLRGLSQNLKGREFYVHIPDKEYKIYTPTIKQVPDCKITQEIWIQSPVKLKCIGKIKVIKDSGEDGIPYKYGNNTAELYDWDWEWTENMINESSIEEITTAMMTIPPMRSADANVMVANSLSGAKVNAISPLDFNDTILIDDEEEGIKKISKEEFRENYTIKDQFLYPKNEKYYNLLEAVRTKSDEIYNGIYKNLSSFDYILTEDQIYFDKEFKQLKHKGVDENIFALSDKVNSVNNALELDIADGNVGINLPDVDTCYFKTEYQLKGDKPTLKIKAPDNSVIATLNKSINDLTLKDKFKIEESWNVLVGGKYGYNYTSRL